MSWNSLNTYLNQLNNLGQTAVYINQLKKRDEALKWEQGTKMIDLGLGALNQASSEQGVDAAADIVLNGFQSINGMNGLNLDLEGIKKGYTENPKEALKYLKEISKLRQDHRNGLVNDEVMLKGLYDYQDKLSALSLGEGNVNTKVKDTMKSLGLLQGEIADRQQKSQRITMLEGMLNNERDKVAARYFVESGDEAGVRGLLNPKQPELKQYDLGNKTVYMTPEEAMANRESLGGPRYKQTPAQPQKEVSPKGEKSEDTTIAYERLNSMIKDYEKKPNASKLAIVKKTANKLGFDYKEFKGRTAEYGIPGTDKLNWGGNEYSEYRLVPKTVTSDTSGNGMESQGRSSRSTAIAELKKRGYPVTEANIKKLLEQIGG